MKKKLLIFLTVLLMLPVQIFAWQGMPTPMLHVEGNKLKDPSGKDVLLHGWMQPDGTWFNGEGNRYSDPTDWTNPGNVAGMLNFLKDAANIMSDPSPKYGQSHGWYASFVRLNCGYIGGFTQENGLVNQAQFNGWIQNLIVPYANHLRSRGLYLLICATGPINTPNNGARNAGVTEQARLCTFWSTVANAPGIKNADNIMFELMNEPVQIESSPGNGQWGSGSGTYFQAFRNWMQPVINDIRNTGANNVIWVPCLGWQGEPHGWVQYPFTGSNIGVAAHLYPAYGGVYNNATAMQNMWNSNYKPAADRWPMIITECMWYPGGTGYEDLFNGTTAGFGNNLKNAIDNQGNVSFLVGFLADHLVNLVNTPLSNTSLGTHEGTQAYFSWLPTYTWTAPSDGCSPTSITPYFQINDGAWQQSASVTVNSGDKVVFGPQPVSGGSWSWNGGGTSGSSREQTIYPTSSSSPTATYTNTCGTQSSQVFNVTVSGSSGNKVRLIKSNAPGFALDGGNGGANGQQIYLWVSDANNVNQTWVEINRGGGYYSYQKINTNYCIDGGNGGANSQQVKLWTCDANNQNQQWQKISAGTNFRLQKRNASGYSIDGGNGGVNGQSTILWTSDANNQNQQWTFSSSPLKSASIVSDEESIPSTEKILAYPNPVIDMLNLQLASNPKEIVVYSMEGKQLYRLNTTSKNVEIDFSSFKSGVYIVKAIGQNEIWIKKVIKL